MYPTSCSDIFTLVCNKFSISRRQFFCSDFELITRWHHTVNCLYAWYIRGVDMTNIERESINFKLPKTLTKALRAAARERNTTATDLVIQGLHHIHRTNSWYRKQCRNSSSRTGNSTYPSCHSYRGACRKRCRRWLVKTETFTVGATIRSARP